MGSASPPDTVVPNLSAGHLKMLSTTSSSPLAASSLLPSVLATPPFVLLPGYSPSMPEFPQMGEEGRLICLCESWQVLLHPVATLWGQPAWWQFFSTWLDSTHLNRVSRLLKTESKRFCFVLQHISVSTWLANSESIFKSRHIWDTDRKQNTWTLERNGRKPKWKASWFNCPRPKWLINYQQSLQLLSQIL